MKKVILLSLLCITGCQSRQHVNNTTVKADSAYKKDPYPAWMDRRILATRPTGSTEDVKTKPVAGAITLELVEINSESSRQLVKECISNHAQSNGVVSREEIDRILGQIAKDHPKFVRHDFKLMLCEDQEAVMFSSHKDDHGVDHGNAFSAKVSGPNDGEQILHVTAQGLRERSDAKPGSPLERWTLVRSAPLPMDAGLICEVEEKTDAPKLVVFVKRSKA